MLSALQHILQFCLTPDLIPRTIESRGSTLTEQADCKSAGRLKAYPTKPPNNFVKKMSGALRAESQKAGAASK
jgi:hypothetical protein